MAYVTSAAHDRLLLKRQNGGTHSSYTGSLEARQAFLTPEEIKQLRKDLGLLMEEFAQLIGSTRQSVPMWEKETRTKPPVRIADLLMKRVCQFLAGEPVDVLPSLLNEARKWRVIAELSQTMQNSNKSEEPDRPVHNP